MAIYSMHHHHCPKYLDRSSPRYTTSTCRRCLPGLALIAIHLKSRLNAGCMSHRQRKLCFPRMYSCSALLPWMINLFKLTYNDARKSTPS